MPCYDAKMVSPRRSLIVLPQSLTTRTKRALSLSTVVILGGVALWSLPAHAAPVWSDPLTGAQIDPTRWAISRSSADMTLAPSSEGVLMSMAGSAHGTSFVAALSSLCSVEGDFDIQVDYELGLWPAKSGVRTGLSAGSKSGFSATVQRDSLSATDVPVQKSGSEVYLTDFEPMSGGTFMDVPTADVRGTLRLVRSSGSATAYFASPGASWTIVASVAAPSEPVTLTLQTWSADGIYNKQSGGASVTFRNFAVNSGQLNCPDVGTSDTTITTIGGHSSSGCACSLTGKLQSNAQRMSIFFLGLCLAALARRRRS